MSDQYHDILVLMERELGELRQLSTLIDQERETIVANDLTRLGTLLEQKLNASQEMARTEQALHTALSALGLALDQHGMEEFINNIDDPRMAKAASACWRDVRALANDCRQKNAVNGRIIEANKQAAEEMLRILKGQKPEDRELYDPSGRSVNVSLSQSLAKA